MALKNWPKIFLLFFSFQALALDYPYTLRSPKGLIMGDAFTAVADDEYTLFYNPAALARHRRDITFYPFSGHLSGTNVLSDMDRFKDFPDEPVGVSDVLMDYPVHASAGVAPGFKLFNVGVSFIANDSVDVLLRNKTHPMLDLDIRSDKGVAVGMGIPLGTHRISRKSQSGSQTSLGLGLKYIERRGVRDSVALTGPVFNDALGKDEISEVMKSLGQVRGIGWGYDAGIEHVVREGPSQFVMGISALDITGTEFKVPKNPDNLRVADNRSQVNFGLAGGQDFKYFHYIISSDVRALNEEMDFGKRLRFGAQLGIPGITLMAGMNSGYYSYGAMLDLAFIKIMGGFYDIELGSKYKQTKSKRFILYLSLFNFSFDA
jgi:hypothetical protein